MATVHYPNESPQYRAARERLLQAEMALREQVEQVARLRRALPPGGALAQDYEFSELCEGRIRPVRLSQLFGEHDSLFLYCFMFGPHDERPCPMCSSFLDGLNGNAVHIMQRVALAVVARASIERVAEFASVRGWPQLRVLSSHDTTFQRDYLGEDEAGEQMPMANVFVRADGEIRHFWGSELLYAPSEGHPRHLDQLWPLWNLLDTTPQGRGDFFPPL